MLCVILDCIHLLTYDCNFGSSTLKLLIIMDLFIMNDLHRGQSHVIYAYGYNGVTSTHDSSIVSLYNINPLIVYCQCEYSMNDNLTNWTCYIWHLCIALSIIMFWESFSHFHIVLIYYGHVAPFTYVYLMVNGWRSVKMISVHDQWSARYQSCIPHSFKQYVHYYINHWRIQQLKIDYLLLIYILNLSITYCITMANTDRICAYMCVLEEASLCWCMLSIVDLLVKKP